MTATEQETREQIASVERAAKTILEPIVIRVKTAFTELEINEVVAMAARHSSINEKMSFLFSQHVELQSRLERIQQGNEQATRFRPFKAVHRLIERSKKRLTALCLNP